MNNQPFPPPKKKRTHAPFLSGDPVDGFTLVDFPNWNLRITKPHGVGPRVLRDGDFSNCAERPNKTQNTVEVFLPFKSWKANSAEKNWNDSFQKPKKKENGVKLLSCYAVMHVSTAWPFIQEFLQLVWTLHTSTDFLLHMTGAVCKLLPVAHEIHGHLLGALRKHSPCGPVKTAYPRLSP